jgi:hypothetical protein
MEHPIATVMAFAFSQAESDPAAAEAAFAGAFTTGPCETIGMGLGEPSGVSMFDATRLPSASV